VPWLSGLVFSFLLRRPKFDTWTARVGFVMNELALGEDFILVFGYSVTVSFQKSSNID
jgi:hypothetical protein